MKCVIVVLAFVLVTWPSAGTGAIDEGAWHYVVPKPGEPFEYPPLRALTLSASKPADAEEKVKYRGSRQRYAQLRFGSPTSVRVTIVVDEIGSNDVDLYVDTARKRTIEDRDKVTGKDLTWRLPLEMHHVQGTVITPHRRTVIFRFGPVGRSLSFAAAGYLEGTVQIGGRKHLARRQDGDANGFWTNPHDRLWIDLNADGRWDPVAEQFLYAPVLKIGPERYAVRSDELGSRLALTRLEGTGTIRLSLGMRKEPIRLQDLDVTFIGRDGSAVSLAGPTTEAVVPVGDYRLSAVTVTLADGSGGPPWTFTFSDSGGRPTRRWSSVAKDAVLTIDPIGKLELQLDLDKAAAVAGKEFKCQPQLFTGDGLLIVRCWRGQPDSPGDLEGTYAQVTLEAPGVGRLSRAKSGFL